jgi:hypothetical protein
LLIRLPPGLLRKRRGQAAVPQQRAIRMVYDVAGNNKLTNRRFVVVDTKRLNRRKLEITAVKDIEF